ncbi:GATOR complex protein Iml1 isoform X1 [Drosophila guanche]|uniref:Blast:DEP domain-containing protein 5 n=1 Tax=Drosophila guanche TaxID=7266 RepID=A0A3B0JUX3_DROGU|nr:GATOR complex protein Iml1 isoform X1 [Drosophila guanche]SPP84863.1 blast:DEP domain-containing protein 5 [Drosophila guanche]
MKLYKLNTHTRGCNKSYDADLVMNLKDHPNANVGDVVEIYVPDDENGTHLLLQITEFSGSCGRDVISIESGIAIAFKWRPYSNVVMRIVNPADVALDSIEITFKDQYMGRSEMWRLKTYLTDTCVYVNKKIDYNDMQIRCQVYEMWSQGERVASGVITEDTKIVFRSSTSMVYLFLQMSSEMWDFDIHGDLYFEKAVNGFLTELFQKWKKLSCNHEVTIVLFSRTFYAAKSLDEFPEHMRDCLQLDYKGRFYEDFYRVAIQNERNDDWCTVLGQLRKLFTSYQETVLRYHERQHMKIPPATNSTATQGNFLEVLNISLNTFEKHYLDRTFDRTGQLSVVITPGVGVFSVDRELTNITKQRIIDNGVGSDLVCVGEQPLHAVPLLKFHNKDTTLTSADDYSLPHWINLSFYSTNKKIAYSSFIPRIKLPLFVSDQSLNADEGEENERNFLSCKQSEYKHNSLFDYDAYDEQIFQPLPAQSTCSLQRVVRAKKTSVPSLETYAYRNNDWENLTPTQIPAMRRKMSDPDIHHGTSAMLATLPDTTNLSESLASEKNSRRTIVSIAPIVRPGRALINPFDPSQVTIKLTSNRRRWTHIFPKGPTGVLIQQHHYQAVPAKIAPAGQRPLQQLHNNSQNSTTNNNETEESACDAGEQYDRLSTHSMLSKSVSSHSFVMGDEKMDFFKRRQNSLLNALPANVPNLTATQAKSYVWGATGEQEWTPAITTVLASVAAAAATGKHLRPIVESEHPFGGDSALEPMALATESEMVGKGKIIIGVDWKSLTIPACLPITTDYFPDKRSLHNDYVISDYTLLPDDVNHEYAQSRAIYRKPLSTEEVCKEIVSQRLAQGFQLIVGEERPSVGGSGGTCSAAGGPTAVPATSAVLPVKPSESNKEYLLSIGRIFHKISLIGSVITVTGYRPRHPYPPINVDYRYRFHAPQHETYEISGVNFTTEKLENFNWNHMDLYICTRGDVDYPLMESLKYWRYRMYLLPRENIVSKIASCQRCDIFPDVTVDNTSEQVDDFVRLIEAVSKLKRQFVRKARDSPTAHSLTKRRHSTSIISRPQPTQGLMNSPFRERVGSNRLPEKRPSINARPKLDNGRISRVFPATDAAAAAGLAARDDQDDGFPVDIKFSPNATLVEIFEAMKHPVNGVGYFSQTQSLPSCTFLSYDALMWLKTRLNNGRHPLELLEAMRKERMICHASGDWSKPVVAGFVFYYVVQQDKNAKDYAPPLNDYCAFVNEWLEIEFQGCSFLWHDEPVITPIPNFLRDFPAPQSWTDYCSNKRVYRQSHLEIDVNQKSDRMEWGHVKHHTVLQPGFAFEIVVEWVTSSGPIVSDLIGGWMRKANQFNFLVSVPADPMAEPFTKKSDPLRGPIFIPLCVTFLPNGAALFEEFPEESRSDRMLFLQEAILAKFGFLPCVLEKKYSIGKDLPKEYQYVHCTGNMFALIRCATNNYQVESPTLQEANFTRCVYGHTNNTNVPKKVGFLWSWNHMIPNKKWKAQTINNSADGELFQLKMLKDFREFCSNSDQRLATFWSHCQELKRKNQSFEFNNNNNNDEVKMK